jgi:hypothetical protein
MSGLMTSDQFNTTARATKSLGQQSNQCFVGRRIHGRRSDPDSQFVGIFLVRQDFTG